MKQNYTKLENAEYTTGLRRGYIHVKDQGVESQIMLIPRDLKGYRGNMRWAFKKLLDKGATHYTVADDQAYGSSQYCYSVYYGYSLAVDNKKK